MAKSLFGSESDVYDHGRGKKRHSATMKGLSKRGRRASITVMHPFDMVRPIVRLFAHDRSLGDPSGSHSLRAKGLNRPRVWYANREGRLLHHPTWSAWTFCRQVVSGQWCVHAWFACKKETSRPNVVRGWECDWISRRFHFDNPFGARGRGFREVQW